MRLIDADELRKEIDKQAYPHSDSTANDIYFSVLHLLADAPTVDAVEVVQCRYCIMHNNCTTEDAFKLCGIEDPFCCAGKRKEPVKPPEETEDSFLMQRFLKVE